MKIVEKTKRKRGAVLFLLDRKKRGGEKGGEI